MLMGKGHVKRLWEFRSELMGLLSLLNLDLEDTLGHLHSRNETRYDYKRNCASGPFYSVSVSMSCY